MADENLESATCSIEEGSPISPINNDLLDENVEDIEDLIINKSGPMEWIQTQIANDANPRDILRQLMPELIIPDHVEEVSLWRLAFEILSEPAPRKQLKEVNSLEHVKNLLSTCKNIVVLTGAGVSVSCGIPDFRSRDGIYARLSKDYPDLPNPQAMFDIHYFKSNQWPFFKFAKEIYPGQFTPSLSHRFISYLDRTGRLLRNYSQNIDTLEQVASIKNVVQCHGSFATATCMNCKHKLQCEEIKKDIFDQKIPYCTKCTVTPEDGQMNVIKPDIVFFGESLPQAFHRQIQDDKSKADLLIVIGSSLKVRPVSLIPNLIRPDVPQILINREPLSNFSFDVELYGNCDDVIAELCTQLGSDWTTILGDFKTSPLDRQKWKIFYDHCTDTSNSEEAGTTEEEESSQEINGESSQEANRESPSQEEYNGKSFQEIDGKSSQETNGESSQEPNGESSKNTNEEASDKKFPKIEIEKSDPVEIANSDKQTNKYDVGGNNGSDKIDDLKQKENEQSIKIQPERTSQKKSKCTCDDKNSVEIGCKRKCTCGYTEEENDQVQSPNKKSKANLNNSLKDDIDEDVYYLSLPPNRYLFNGAEIHLGFDGDSEESESEAEDDSLINGFSSVTNGLDASSSDLEKNDNTWTITEIDNDVEKQSSEKVGAGRTDYQQDEDITSKEKEQAPSHPTPSHPTTAHPTTSHPTTFSKEDVQETCSTLSSKNAASTS